MSRNRTTSSLVEQLDINQSMIASHVMLAEKALEKENIKVALIELQGAKSHLEQSRTKMHMIREAASLIFGVMR